VAAFVTSAQPVVSILMPVFNGDRFLAESIESVLAQCFTDWELLVVDDGSTDRSPEIAGDYARRHPGRVRYLEHEGHVNRGATTSRNLALRAAAGRYLALLDADDVWFPGKLTEQLAVLTAEPRATMVYGATQYWSSWAAEGGGGSGDYVAYPASPRDCVVPPPVLLLKNHPLGPGPAPCPSDLLLRREMVDAVGGFEEEFQGDLQLYEDQAFLAKIYLSASVYVSSRCWLRYRLHADSCDARVRRTGQERRARLYFLEWLQRYLRDRPAEGPGVARALAKAMWRTRHPVLHRATRRVLRPFGRV
jgi:glycosyltransferase involved in cell wall biosynthesis